MLRRITPKNILLSVFVAAECAIYIAFNVMAGAGKPDPIYLKYSGVLLCLVASFALIFLTDKCADCILLSCALLFTAVSDLFILVLDDYYEIGLFTFIITQSIYFYRLYAGRIKKIFISLGARLAVMTAVIIAFAAIGKLNLLVAECAVYITMLVGNVTDAFVICRKCLKNVLFAVGLLLFLGCDLCVGLHNFGTVLNVTLPAGVVNFVAYAIWAFYLPSQVLITCSFNRSGLNPQLAEPVVKNGAEAVKEEENEP